MLRLPTMDLRTNVQFLSLTSSINLWAPWQPHLEPGKSPSHVRFLVCQVKSAIELSPKEVHHMQKKTEWKKKRRLRKLQKLEEDVHDQEKHAGNEVKQMHRKEGLTSFEKYRLCRSENRIDSINVWRSGKKEKSSIVGKFEEEFANRVKDAVSLISYSNTTSSGHQNDDHVQNSSEFREDPKLGFDGDLEGLVDGSDQFLLANGHEIYVKDVCTPMEDRTEQQRQVSRSKLRVWCVKPKTPRWKDQSLGLLIRNRWKGEPLSQLIAPRAESLPLETCDILKVLREDVDSEVRRRPVDEQEQLGWLVEQLCEVGKVKKLFLSRVMHGARLKWTEGRLLETVKMLGERRNWRRAMEVVHWVHCREHFKHCRSRYVFTTLLALLGKCLRPVEALNIFNVMREEYSTYPDMAAYHCIAVTLGQAGHLTQLLDLIESLKEGPKRNHIPRGTPNRLNWDGCLKPDIVVYNSVINACGGHREWKGTVWVLKQMKSQGIAPNSATYGLAIEVMVRSGQFATAWRLYERMERGGYLPNASTFKALVEALGIAGETDKAVEMVGDMEQRGVLKFAGVYYALASALCTAGRWSEALEQVEKLKQLPSRKSDVITYTGLIRTCEKSGRWQDAISIFQRMQYSCAPNVGTYNIMIALYGKHGMFEKAQELYECVKRGLHKEGRFPSMPRLSPDVYTYEAMLGACAASNQWEYFEDVFQDVLIRGFELEGRRHAWLISPLVKAGEEGLVNQLVSHVRSTDGSASIDVFTVLLTSLQELGQHTLVLHYLNFLLEQGIDLDTQEWSSLVGAVLERLPMVDVEHFISTKITSENLDSNILVEKLLHCLLVVGAVTKAESLISLLGLEVDELLAVTNVTLGDSRLLPQEDENKN